MLIGCVLLQQGCAASVEPNEAPEEVGGAPASASPELVAAQSSPLSTGRGDGTPHVQLAPSKSRVASTQHAQGTGATCGGAAHLSLSTGGAPMQGPSSGNTVTIVPVEWGQGKLGYSLTNGTPAGSDIDSFIGQVFQGVSDWYSWIRREYHLGNINRRTPAQLTLSSGSGTPNNAAKTLVTDSDIQAEILYQLGKGSLPTDSQHSVASMLYVIHFPSTVQVKWDSKGDELCGGANGTTWGFNGPTSTACAYNSNPTSVTYNGASVHYAVLPDETRAECALNCASDGIAGFALQTEIESHEVIEALSDSSGGWYDTGPNNCGQIGDICNQQPATTFGVNSVAYTVQTMWSNVANSCESNNPRAPADFGGTGASGIALIGNTDPSNPNASVLHFAQPSQPGLHSYTLTPQNLGLQDPSFMQSEIFSWPVTGDFDGDGLADIALVNPTLNALPIARSIASAFQFSVTNGTITAAGAPPGLGQAAPFIAIMQQSPLPPKGGDFNGDGLADIALVGGRSPNGAAWQSIPIAFSTGTGDFWSTNNADHGFNANISQSADGAQLVAGDFDGDGLTDLALVGLTWTPGAGKSTIAIAYSTRDRTGNFRTALVALGAPPGGSPTSFNTWAATPGVMAVAGDFDGDGYADIALAGGPGWTTVPVAFMRNGGSANPSFTVTNSNQLSTTSFASQASASFAELLAGDFDGDGVTDLALTGPSSWSFVGFGFSPHFSTGVLGAFTWEHNASGLGTFTTLAGLANVWAVSGQRGGQFLAQCSASGC